MARELLPKVINALEHQKGLKLIKDRYYDSFIPFEWEIPTSQGEKKFLVYIPKDLDSIPSVQLTEYQLLQPLPHIMNNGWLCYLDGGSYVFNKFDPINQTLACIDKAKEVVKKIFNNEYDEDFYSEFFSYWSMYWLKENKLYNLYVDIDRTSSLNACKVFLQKNNFDEFYITNNIDKLKQKINKSLLFFCNATLLKTCALRPYDPWPPSQGYQFCDWLGKNSRKIRKKFIDKALPKNQESFKVILLDSPQGFFGVGLGFTNIDKTLPHKRLFGATVYLMTTTSIDADFVCKRNIPNSLNLTDKKIALIGCGSIGGFLSDFLIKLGAGNGSGVLTLIDSDKFEAANIGRHFLGYPSINMPKVQALRHDLLRLMPTLNIKCFDTNANKLQFSDLEQYDLIIDATGEEAIGNHLCSVLSGKTLLSLWIEGNGLAARGLLHHRSGGACYHCIRHYELEGKLLSIKNNPGIILSGGCRTPYVTYPVMAAIEAANLGAMMVLDWANNIYEPSFRTRLIDFSQELETTDCNPVSHPNCPICNLNT